MTDLIEVSETGEGVPYRLSPDQVNALESTALKLIRLSQVRGHTDLWQVKGNKKVGSARIGGIDVHVTPKYPIKRVLFMLGYVSGLRSPWLAETPALTEESGLVAAMAQPLWRQAELALAQGVLYGYRARDSVSTVLRGRLRETEQIYRSHGLKVPLQVRHDDLTRDIPENQILRTAIVRILRVPGVDDESRLRLHRLLQMLTGVNVLAPGLATPTWTMTRLNARYAKSLKLAELILDRTSVGQGAGRVESNGFVVDMQNVYENFVRSTIGDQLVRRHGGGQNKPKDVHLDEGNTLHLEPDLVWYRPDGRPGAVVDAKYAEERPTQGGGSREHLYQVMSYCAVLGLRSGHIVYARGHDQPTTYTIQTAGTEITCHSVDLDQPPSRLIADMHAIADRIGHQIQ